MTARVILNWIVVVVLCAAAAATQKTADAETYAVRVVRDVPYLEGGRYADGKDKLDIYLPEGRRNTAVLVSYYGNQLMGGDKSEDGYIGRRFAAAGFVTVVVNYRLSPAVSHPAHIQDAAASFAWVKRHIAEYGGNGDRIFIIGYSAGAYLAALLSTDARHTRNRSGQRVLLGRAARRCAGPRQERVGQRSQRLDGRVARASSAGRRAADVDPLRRSR